MKIKFINGPNINMLGKREPEIYGNSTYADLIAYIADHCHHKKVTPQFFQSNCEGEIVSAIQQSLGRVDAIVINPAAYTHTSIAILDALKAVALPAVEVHISDVDAREDFRKISYAGMACVKRFSGMGFAGYTAAIDFLLDYLKD